MNKKVLSALLFGALMAGTGTFTSCIDTDEPEGIENLRGAKAELIRAKVAVEAANAAYVQAQAQLTLADAKIKEAKARWEEASAACKEAEAELLAAQTAEQKALLEKNIADYKNQMAEAALTHEKEMLRLQGELAKQQQTYDETIAAIEIAKLTLNATEAEILGDAQDVVTTAAKSVNDAYATLVEAQANVNNMMTAKAKVTLAQLEASLAYEKATLGVAEFTVTKAKQQLALAEKFDAEAWNAQIADLKEEKQSLKDSLDVAEVELVKVHVGDEFQAAEDAYKLAVETLGANVFIEGKVSTDKKEYIKGVVGAGIVNNGTQTIGESEELTLASKKVLANNDLTAALNGTLEDEDGNKLTAFALEAYESNAINPSLMEFINKSTELKSMITTNSDNESVFSYGRAPYTEGGYQAQLEYLAKDAEYVATGGAMKVTQTLEGWIAELNKFSTDKNGEAWAGIEVEKLKAALEDTKAAYEADSTAWDIMLKAYKGTATTAPTNVAKWTDAELNADVDAAVTAYNTAYGAVGTAVAAYNASLNAYKTASDAVYTAAYNAKVAGEKNAYYISQYYSYAKTSLTLAQQTTWEGLPVASQTEATLDAYLNNKEVSDAFKAKALTDQAQHYASAKVNDKETNPALIALAALAEEAGDAAVAADEDETIADALAAIEEDGTLATMDGAIEDAVEAYNGLVSAMANYKKMLAADYGQVLTGKNLTKIGTNEAGKLSYLKANGNIDFGTVAADIKISNDASKYIANEKKDDGKTDKAPIAGHYLKTLTTNVSDITAAEKANLVLAALNEDDSVIKTALKTKSEKAFGDLAWDATSNEYRAIAPTREEVEALGTDLDDCGSFGALLKAENNIALYEGMATAGESVAPIVEELTAQLEAVEAEIAANSAIVAEYQAKYDAAVKAYEDGEAAVDAAFDAREAVCAEAEALVDAFEEKVSYVELLINTAQSQLDQMYPGTIVAANTKPIDANQIVAYWKQQVALAEKNLATTEDAVIAAEQAIEQFNAGVYNEEMQYKQAVIKLETATAAYETALSVYNQRLAELKAIIEALAK